MTLSRQVMAITISRRVAYKVKVNLGTQVGYKVRFENMISEHTVIKNMTDGNLIRDAMTRQDVELN